MQDATYEGEHDRAGRGPTPVAFSVCMLLCGLPGVAAGADGRPEQPLPSLLPAWQKLEVVPILHYQWPPAKDEQERQTRFADYLEMGFTGIYKLDQEPPRAGKLFRDHGLHGVMLQTRFQGTRDPVLDPDGQPAQFRIYRRGKPHPYCRSIFSPRNVKTYHDRIVNMARRHGVEGLFTVNGTIVASSWDETGLYSRKQMEYGYTARDEFAAYLEHRVFHDARPDQDTNGDGRTFNAETGLAITDWATVPMPRFNDRYKTPGLWKHWVDFHGYYTYLFFRRMGEAVGKALGREFELFTFSHGSAKWPSAASQWGLDLCWQSRLNRVLMVEDCSWDYPGSTIAYALTDQLSRRYRLPVVGCSWFSPWLTRANDPLHVARALARAIGHNTHGLVFWVYVEDSWRKKPAARAGIAHWHRIFQAHWPFLRTASVPPPQVAIMRSRNTGNMYGAYQYPKLDFGWTCAALSEAHIPFDVIVDNQVEHEPNVLADYRVLLVPGATWESPQVRRRIERFVAGGGYVYTNGTSFLLDTVTGRPTDFPARVFGIQPTRKYKGLFAPSYDSAPEADWARRHAGKWQAPTWEGTKDRSKFRARGEKVWPATMADADLGALRDALSKVSGTGLAQELWDPRQPQWVTPTQGKRYRSFHDIVTGTPQRGATVLARYRGQVCAVETERTVWTGFAPGHDHACLFPVYNMRQWGEPMWPFQINTATTAHQRRGPRKWLCRVIRKAGVRPLVAVAHQGKPASHVEVLARQNKAGNALVFVINHEPIAGTHVLTGNLLAKAPSCRELRTSTALTPDDQDRFTLDLRAGHVAILAVGTHAFVARRQAAHNAIKKTVAPMPLYKE